MAALLLSGHPRPALACAVAAAGLYWGQTASD